MAFPAKWNVHSILALELDYGLSAVDAMAAVTTFDSLDDYLHFARHDKSPALFPSETSKGNADAQLETCGKKGYRIITFWDADYPILLRNITYPPALLFVVGRLSESDSVSVSIVGTRHASTYGKITAERFGEYFARQNIIVTSGLAYGIDSAAHKSAVRARGTSYAIVASGLDCIAPYWAQKLAETIIENNGAIISEYRCGTIARPGYFPQRNRIISGISKATLVVESAEKGGSMITARFALDQSRELFAVPGNITSRLSTGTNLLIAKYAATPALSPEFVLDSLGITELISEDTPQFEGTISDDERKVLKMINYEPIHIDMLARALGVEMPELLNTLLSLEFKDMVKQLPGKHYILFK